MGLSQDTDAQLLKLPWRSLRVGECSFLGKVHFTESSYALLLSDLCSVWFEEADSKAIEERSRELNKRLKAPISSFLSHLSQLLLPLLDSQDQGPGGFSCCRADGTLTLKVKSQLSGLPFFWNFQCREASVSTVCCHFLRPLTTMTDVLDRQCQELRALLKRKDAEIQDYQESGAVLTLGRLKTEVFDEESFNESCLAKAKEPSRPSKTLGFSTSLQQLYCAATEAEATPAPVDRGVCAGIPSTLDEKDKSPTLEDSRRGDGPKPSQVLLTCSASQGPPVAVSKPKKKKVKGLFV
uniref:Non-homologous end-joining factor 1 n=1 Tax=Leptobrachium leishanense TaxID=445787 RepID=A0A8C5PZU2_9ANUR